MIETLREYGNKVCLFDANNEITYQDMADNIVDMAITIERRTEGKTLCIYMQHSMDYILCGLASLEAGKNVYFLHPNSSKRILDVVKEDHVIFLCDEIGKEKLISIFGVKEADILLKADIVECTTADKRFTSKLNLSHVILTTSGTTSIKPKFVCQPFHNILLKSKMLMEQLGIKENDVNLLISPLCFIQSIWTLTIHMIRGAKVCVKAFEPHKMEEDLQRYHITTLITTPSVIRGTINEIQNTYQLRLISIGGDYMDNATLEQLKLKWPEVCYANVYGTTESAAADVVFEPRKFGLKDKSFESIGKESWYSSVFIMREDKSIAAPYEQGMICIESPMVQNNYYHSDIQIKETNGLYVTYDVGYKDENGAIYYCGRNTNIIVTNGQKISACEVEKILYEIDGIDEVVVLGKNHSIYGQVPYCFLVAKPSVTEEYIRSYLENRVEKYMIPRKFVFVEALKKTISDKIIRNAEVYEV